ncbi:hypothetical protein ACIBBB_20595 [Streptomyces sp. NPDC051217]
MQHPPNEGEAIRTRTRDSLVDAVAVCVLITCTAVLLVLINRY